jgi:hypothetical protein
MITGMSLQRATLLAAIRKAMANGLSQQYFEDFVYEECMHSRPMALRGLLFGREFAEALFGTDLMEWKVGGYRMLDPDGRPVRVAACDFHLQQMVISPDPLAYVKKHAQL